MPTLSPQQVLNHLDRNTYWPHGCGLSVPEAYQHALAVHELRVGRGEKPLGFKIGFTNRAHWEPYGVFTPIWGTMYDTTVQLCDGSGELDIGGCSEPRLEPEAVFGISATPPARADLDELFDCVEWVAPGFEIVQSHMPGYRFTAADSIADGGLHGRLLVGARQPVHEMARSATELNGLLAQNSVALLQGDEVKEHGRGARVLDGPLHALLHLLQALRDCPGAPDLQAGDLVTTGSWTNGQPVKPGEQWRAQFDGPLGIIQVRFR
ncbi:2-keto-4-pentenoate hydratase, partial [Mesorhizobium sp. ZC-5]|uniref:2-keto-4-pentenoate hydratase n=1 Tax=Mesorhizobium sp. ZC-5 TaxID=2986066 RepID=UPI0021E7C0AF